MLRVTRENASVKVTPTGRTIGLYRVTCVVVSGARIGKIKDGALCDLKKASSASCNNIELNPSGCVKIFPKMKRGWAENRAPVVSRSRPADTRLSPESGILVSSGARLSQKKANASGRPISIFNTHYIRLSFIADKRW